MSQSTFAVLAWNESTQQWQVVQGGFQSYKDASTWARQFETPSMPACVRREPVVLPRQAVAA